MGLERLSRGVVGRWWNRAQGVQFGWSLVVWAWSSFAPTPWIAAMTGILTGALAFVSGLHWAVVALFFLIGALLAVIATLWFLTYRLGRGQRTQAVFRIESGAGRDFDRTDHRPMEGQLDEATLAATRGALRPGAPWRVPTKVVRVTNLTRQPLHDCRAKIVRIEPAPTALSAQCATTFSGNDWPAALRSWSSKEQTVTLGPGLCDYAVLHELPLGGVGPVGVSPILAGSAMSEVVLSRCGTAVDTRRGRSYGSLTLIRTSPMWKYSLPDTEHRPPSATSTRSVP